MNNLKYYDDLQSKTISFLRFLLIIGIVFIHSEAEVIVFKSMHLNTDQIPLFYYTTKLFTSILPKVSVPLFFFISGFLFFFNVDFTKNIYFKKLRSRIKTLFIPYIFWITVILIFFIIIQNVIPKYTLIFKRNIVLNYSFINYLHVYGVGSHPPISVQFWFIRELIILIILTPIIYYIIDKIKYFFIFFIGILWYFNFFSDFYYVKISSLFFFCFGAYYSIKKKNLVIEFKKLFYISTILYPIFVVICVFTTDNFLNLYTLNFCNFTGVILLFSIVSLLIENNYIKVSLFLSSSSFFIFAFHLQPQIIITNILFNLLKHDNDILLTLFYFLSVIITISISIISYYYLNKFFPKFTNFIIGGRNFKNNKIKQY